MVYRFNSRINSASTKLFQNSDFAIPSMGHAGHSSCEPLPIVVIPSDLTANNIKCLTNDTLAAITTQDERKIMLSAMAIHERSSEILDTFDVAFKQITSGAANSLNSDSAI